MDFILTQFAGFGAAFTALVVDPLTYVYLISSVFLGISFGALPGLTATLAVTILTGFFGNKIPLDYSLIALLGAFLFSLAFPYLEAALIEPANYGKKNDDGSHDPIPMW